jgi:hypothetical protein
MSGDYGRSAAAFQTLKSTRAVAADLKPESDRILAEPDHDPIRLNRIMISSLCLSMIFSENRLPLFRIML